MAVFNITKEKTIGRILKISTAMIMANPSQPRRSFDESELQSLAESIKENGIINPLSVRRVEVGFELISGERRLRAAQLLGLNSVPCVVIESDREKSAVLALVENIQRSDLDFFEEAIAINRLIGIYGLTQEQAASRLGKAQSTIANKLRLLRFSDDEMSKITESQLTERHARALLRIDDLDVRDAAIDHVVRRGLNVEHTEEYVTSLLLQQCEAEEFKKRCVVLKDVRLFVNTINKAIETMRAAGIMAESHRQNYDNYIEYTVKIPTE